MRIIQINASYKPAYIYGGPTMSVSKLCETLKRAGQDVEVLTTTANGNEELLVKAGICQTVEGVPVTYFPRISKDPIHFSPALLKNLYGRQPVRCDEVFETRQPIIHIHAWWNMVSVLACITALARKYPVVLSPRGTLSGYSFINRNSFLKRMFHVFIGRKILKRCHFHVSTDKEKEDILRLLKPRSIVVIPNFVKFPEALPAPKLNNSPQDKPFKILFLSRIEEKKGLDILFQALAGLQFPFRLTLAGMGKPQYLSALKLLAARLHIAGKIHWLDEQDYDSKFRLIHSHDLLVLPSHDESFANIVIESLAEGTPVLLSNKVGLADYVRTTRLGWISELQPPALAEALIHAYHHPEQRALISRKAPERIRSDFNENTILSQYLLMYKLALTNG